MTTFYCDALTEDGYETVFETEAATKAEAWADFEEGYPDCRIKRVYSAAQAASEEGDRYRRLVCEMDREDY